MSISTGIISIQNRAPQVAPTLGPFVANPDGSYRYSGNRIFEPVEKIDAGRYLDALPNRYDDLAADERWAHLAHVNGVIFAAATEYFEQLRARFMPLPLTTRMISSPGALYGKEKLDYTSDTAPVTLSWFDEEREVFLAESSQIYLELALLQPGIDHVYSIYNSFRKEPGDDTHLSEFHHIEYEGHVSAERNAQIAEGLIRHLLQALFSRAEDSLAYYLWPHQLRKLEACAIAPTLFMRVTYEECMKILLKDTGAQKYQRFTMQDQFGRWEEVRLTEILGSSIAIQGYPLYEVPFYHCRDRNSDPPRAMNTDFIWGGYAEILGAGQRIGETEELEEKAVAFNLPPNDYEPYLRARRQPRFRRSSGFGLGWERFVQGVLRLPSITEACPFPRTHRGVVP